MSALLVALAVLLAFLCGVALCAAVLAVSAMQRNTVTTEGASATSGAPSAPQRAAGE